MKIAPLIGLVVRLPSNVCRGRGGVRQYTVQGEGRGQTVHSTGGGEGSDSTQYRGRVGNGEHIANLVNGDSVDVCVIHKPDDLIGEQLPVVLRRKVGLSGLTAVQLEGFSDPLSQNVEGGISLHDLSHGLLDQGLHTGDPVTKGTRGGGAGGKGDSQS